MFSFVRTRIRWLLIFWIFVVSAIAYLDRVNMSIAGRAIATDFHLSNVQLGWVFSAFILGYAFFQAPAGWLADRMGPRRIIALGVIWWGIFTTLITLFPPGISGVLWLLIGARFLLGVGESVVYPASNCVVASWIPSAERGVANGFIFMGVGFGSAVTSPLIAYVMVHYGWRASFWLSGACGLAAGAVWYVLARDSPKEHPWILPAEEEHIEAGIQASSTPEGVRLSWGAILRDWNIWAITFSYFAYGYAAYIFFSWFFIYLNGVRGLNLQRSSYYTMMPFMAMAIGSIVGGIISDRLTKAYGRRVGRCGVAFAGLALSAVFIALGAYVQSAALASVILAGGAGALYLSQSSFWSVTADIGGKSAGSVSGAMNMGGQFGGALTASLTPAIASHFGWNASFLVAAGLCACGALAWLTVNPAASESAVEIAEVHLR